MEEKKKKREQFERENQHCMKDIQAAEKQNCLWSIMWAQSY